MIGLLWTVLGIIGAVWTISALGVALLVVAARGGDPRVVVDDPWVESGADSWEGPGWERLREAVLAAHRVQLEDRDVARWEKELETMRDQGRHPVPRVWQRNRRAA